MTTFFSIQPVTNNQDELIELESKETQHGKAYELRLYPAKTPLDKCGSLYSKYIERKAKEENRLLSLENQDRTSEPVNLNTQKSFSDYHADFMHLYSRRKGSLVDWKEFHEIQGKYKKILRGVSYEEREAILASYRSEMEDFFARAEQREVKPSTDVVRSESDYTLHEKEFIKVHKKALETQFEREELLLNRIWYALSFTDPTRIKELLAIFCISTEDYENLRKQLSSQAWHEFNACQNDDESSEFITKYEARIFDLIESLDQQRNERLTVLIQENKTKKIEQSPIVSKLMSKCEREIAKNGSDYATKNRYVHKLFSLDDNFLVLEKDFFTPSMEKILEILPNLESRIALSIIHTFKKVKEAITLDIKSQPDSLHEIIATYKDILKGAIETANDRNENDFIASHSPSSWLHTYLNNCALNPSKKPTIIHQTFEKAHKEIASQDPIYQHVEIKKAELLEKKEEAIFQFKSDIWSLLPNLSPYLHYHILNLAFNNPHLSLFDEAIAKYDEFIENYNHIDCDLNLFQEWEKYLDNNFVDTIDLFYEETTAEINNILEHTNNFPTDQTEMLEFLAREQDQLDTSSLSDSSDIENAIQAYRDTFCQKSILENYIHKTVNGELSEIYAEFKLSSLKDIFNLLKQDHFLYESLTSVVINGLYDGQEPQDRILDKFLDHAQNFYTFAAKYRQIFMDALEEKKTFLENKITYHSSLIDPNAYNIHSKVAALIEKAEHQLSTKAKTDLVILEEFFAELQDYIEEREALNTSDELEAAISKQKNLLIESDWQTLKNLYFGLFERILPNTYERSDTLEQLTNVYVERYQEIETQYFAYNCYSGHFMETGEIVLSENDRDVALAQKAVLQEYQTEVENFLIDLELNYYDVAKKVTDKRNTIVERIFSDLLETDRTKFIQLRSRTPDSREDWIRFTDIQSRHRSIIQEIRKNYLPYAFYQDKPLLLPSCNLDQQDLETADREKEAIENYVHEMSLFLNELEKAPIIRNHELNLLPAEILGEVPEVDLSFNTDEREYDLNVRDIANLDIARIFDSVSSRVKEHVTKYCNEDLEIVERRLEALKWHYTSEFISEDQFLEQLQELDTYYSKNSLFEKNWTWLTDFSGTGNLFQDILQVALKVLAWATIVFPLVVLAIMAPMHYSNPLVLAENLNPLLLHTNRVHR